MDYDLYLVKNCTKGTPILRFYGWTPYCITLGANQSYSEINSELTSKHNIDIVKRPTGGRAILHAEELTYSVIMPNSNKLSGKKLYEEISQAIVSGLKIFNSKLGNIELENIQPNFSDLLKELSGTLCFASTAKSEIKFKGKKLVGSAQRKIGSTILQHGSILIGKYHEKLVDFLTVNDNEYDTLFSELRNKTTEISTIIESDVNINHLEESIITGFEKTFDANFLINEYTTASQE